MGGVLPMAAMAAGQGAKGAGRAAARWRCVLNARRAAGLATRPPARPCLACRPHLCCGGGLAAPVQGLAALGG